MPTLSSIKVAVRDALDVGAGVTAYATIDDLPLSGIDAGEQAFVTSTNRFYIYSGSGWYNIALINTNPSFDSGGGPDSSYTLDSNSGTPTTITLLASDPEGIPITYSAVPSDSAADLANILQLSGDSANTFVITAKTLDSIITNGYDSAGGAFDITFRASDGVNLATAISEFSFTYIPFLQANFEVFPEIRTTNTNTSGALTVGGDVIPSDYSYSNVYTGSSSLVFATFEVPEDTVYSVDAYQAQGSAGNSGGGNTSQGGAVYKFNFDISLPAGSKIYIRPGQRGYCIDAGSTADQTSGGSGGISQMFAYIPGVSGPISMSDGNSAVALLVMTGSGSGNDADYQNVNITGASYTTVSEITNSYSTVYSSNGAVYSRTGSSYGGFPNGNATDDAAVPPAITTNYYNSTYCTYNGPHSNYASASTATNAVNGGFAFLSGFVN